MRRVGAAVLDHPLDLADGARGARCQRARRDRVDPVAPAAADLQRQGPRVGLERGLGRRHAAAVARDGPLARHVREREESSSRPEHRRRANGSATRWNTRSRSPRRGSPRRLVSSSGSFTSGPLARLCTTMSRPWSPKSCVSRATVPAMVKSPRSLYRLFSRDLGGHVRHGVERGIERVDPLERERLAARQRERVGHLAALEQLLEDAEGRGPGADADRRAGLDEGLRDGEAETGVVGDAGDEGAFPGEIDGEHGRKVSALVGAGPCPALDGSGRWPGPYSCLMASIGESLAARRAG